MTYSAAFEKALNLSVDDEVSRSNLVATMRQLEKDIDPSERDMFGDLWESVIVELDVEEYWRQVNALPEHLRYDDAED